jgi:hypothetical protein
MKLFIECECGCDVLKIEKVWDGDPDNDEIFWLCIYKSTRMGLWQKIKQAWRYLIYGEFGYNDMTIKRSDIDKVIDFLSSVKGSKAVDA